MKLEDAGDVLNDLSIIFNFDCEPAIVFFDRDSSPLPPGTFFIHIRVIEG